MGDYISREAACEAFEFESTDVISDYSEEYGCELGFSEEKVIKTINKIPSADVRPVVHGKWLKEVVRQPFVHVLYKCSKCGCIRDLSSAFCPACGADMREE